MQKQVNVPKTMTTTESKQLQDNKFPSPNPPNHKKGESKT